MSESDEGKRLRLEKHERSWDDVYRLISWWDLDRIRDAKVMVIGAGALGNEVLKNLALLNVGYIIIVDFDTIEYSNLSRSILFRPDDAVSNRPKAQVAAARLQEINPEIQVQIIKGDVTIDVGLGVFRRMDVVIGCLDNRLARLYTNRYCFKVGKTWIDGALENLAGQLNVYRPKVSCYECQLSELEWGQIRNRLGCPDIAKRNQQGGRIPTTPISASIIGALQAQEALKVIFGNEKQSLAGQTFQYEGMNNMFLVHQASPLQGECLSHDYINDVIASPHTNQNTAAEFMEWCKSALEVDKVILQLDHEWVMEISHPEKDLNYEMMCAKPHLGSKIQHLPDSDWDDGFVITTSLSTLEPSSPHLHLTLAQFGIPPLHIIQVETEHDIHFVELTGDEPILDFK